jgi:hypothetical protein
MTINIISDIIRDRPSFISWDLTEIEVRNKTWKGPCLNNKSHRDHQELITKYYTLNLDIIRFNPYEKCDLVTLKGIEYINIASDPAGFRYLIDFYGSVFSYDHDGGEIKQVAKDFDDFVTNYLFGQRAGEFCGDDYKEDVMRYINRSV